MLCLVAEKSGEKKEKESSGQMEYSEKVSSPEKGKK